MKFGLIYVKKNVLLLLFTCFFSILTFSQEKQKDQVNDFWNHVRFGGSFGLNFGDNFFIGTIAPSAIYEFNNKFALGISISGTYAKREDFFKSTIVGGSVLTLFNPVEFVQISAEFEELNVNRSFDSNLDLEDDNYWYPALFLGVGYRSNSVIFGFRYDVLYDDNKSIYVDPWMPFVRFFF